MSQNTANKSSKTAFRANSLSDQFFAHIPPETAATFTDAQVEALKQACSQLNWKKHPVDIRLSVPVLVNRFYLVVLAGPERRSRSRRRVESKKYPFWTATHAIAAASLLSLIFFSSLGIQKILLPSLVKLVELEPHPARLPWIDGEAECQNTVRTWQDGECKDEENDPNF